MAFTDPFRYIPHPAVKTAASKLIDRIDSDCELRKSFSEGKMLGVLVYGTGEFIAAFSGNVGGKSHIEGFVPPIYDLLDPKGHFKIKEAEISELNRLISSQEESTSLRNLENQIRAVEKEKEEAICKQKTRMAVLKSERDLIRTRADVTAQSESLIRESQFEKAELRRIKMHYDRILDGLKVELSTFQNGINALKAERKSMSDQLQDWIFKQYVVHNAKGEQKSIFDIFSFLGIIPPGGTGECAAPKLLEYAYKNNLKPIAMGEFWYGKSPDTAVRTHGHFYPSCTSKCGPLLEFMLEGMELNKVEDIKAEPTLIYEDSEIVVAEKPSGMPSVPGLNGRESLQEWLQSREKDQRIIAVHRLDMDTSGVMIYAKNRNSEINLKRQFQEQKIRKTYSARLSRDSNKGKISLAPCGIINLPLSPDYDERPRQKVDFKQGKESRTEYQIASHNCDGTIEIIFTPLTGRTHQLRVHSAHYLGLGRPIEGDLLYGGYRVNADKNDSSDTRLKLHALKIRFQHPSTGDIMEFSSKEHMYK